jgi:hypothetical protein
MVNFLSIFAFVFFKVSKLTLSQWISANTYFWPKWKATKKQAYPGLSFLLLFWGKIWALFDTG